MNINDNTALMNGWREYWAKENHLRPVMTVLAPSGKTPLVQVNVPESIDDRWLDPDFVIPNFLRSMEATAYLAEGYPMYWANVGPDIVGAMAGCELKYSPDTAWADHFVSDWNKLPQIKFDPDNFYYKKVIELTKAAVEVCNGRFLIGNTDIHAGLDGLVALRGSERLCFDTIECPEEMLSRVDQLIGLEKQLYNDVDTVIKSTGQKADTHWLYVLNPDEKWYTTSCDFSCMISTDDFEELVIPGLMKELEFFGKSIYHLDGTVALHHLDRLLAIDELDGIQWVPGTGKPSAAHWPELLQKVQAAGKLLTMTAESIDDVRMICEAIRPEGVHIVAFTPSVEAAEAYIKVAEDTCKKWR